MAHPILESAGEDASDTHLGRGRPSHFLKEILTLLIKLTGTAMARNIFGYALIGTCLLLMFLMGLGIKMSQVNHIKRDDITKENVLYIRDWIGRYHEVKGQYPLSLSRLKEFVQDNDDDFFESHWNEYLKDITGQEAESDILNDKGGWFYDAKTGEVRVNLTQPLKAYVSVFYSAENRNEIPCEW